MVPFGAGRRGRPWRGLSSRQWSFFQQRLARTRPHPLDAASHTTRPRIGREQMSRALPLTQRQVRALCEGAKKAGYAPIVQIGNWLLVPEEHAIPAQDQKPIAEDEDFRL